MATTRVKASQQAPDDTTKIWMCVGAFGAVVISLILLPLRGLTSASNLAFVFLIFTICVAEFGGRVPALVSALLSAICLNFFLTEPYLSLAINKREDLVAFVALVTCGLIAAAFGVRSKKWHELATRAANELDILKSLLERLRQHRPIGEMLLELKTNFDLEALIVRDGSGAVLAATCLATERPPVHIQLVPDTLFPVDSQAHQLGAKGFRLPAEGGRVNFQTERGLFAIELWATDPQGLSLDERRTLAIALQLLILELPNQ